MTNQNRIATIQYLTDKLEYFYHVKHMMEEGIIPSFFMSKLNEDIKSIENTLDIVRGK